MTLIRHNTPRTITTNSQSRSILDEIFSDSSFALIDDVLNAISPMLNRNFKPMLEKGYPKIDSWDDGNKLYIDATVPGIDKNDIEIKVKTLEEDPNLSMIALSYKKESSNENKDVKYSCKEIHRSSFSRTFLVSNNIYDLESIKTSMKDGILSITIDKFVEEKKKEPEWKKIEIV